MTFKDMVNGLVAGMRAMESVKQRPQPGPAGRCPRCLRKYEEKVERCPICGTRLAGGPQ